MDKSWRWNLVGVKAWDMDCRLVAVGSLDSCTGFLMQLITPLKKINEKGFVFILFYIHIEWQELILKVNRFFCFFIRKATRGQDQNMVYERVLWLHYALLFGFWFECVCIDFAHSANSFFLFSFWEGKGKKLVLYESSSF